MWTSLLLRCYYIFICSIVAQLLEFWAEQRTLENNVIHNYLIRNTRDRMRPLPVFTCEQWRPLTRSCFAVESTITVIFVTLQKGDLAGCHLTLYKNTIVIWLRDLFATLFEWYESKASHPECFLVNAINVHLSEGTESPQLTLMHVTAKSRVAPPVLQSAHRYLQQGNSPGMSEPAPFAPYPRAGGILRLSF